MEYLIGALVGCAIIIIAYVLKIVVGDWYRAFKEVRDDVVQGKGIFNASTFAFIFSVLGVGFGAYLLFSTGLWIQDSTAKVADIIFRLAIWNGSIAGFVYFLNTRKVDVEEILCTDARALGMSVAGYFIGSALLLTLGF